MSRHKYLLFSDVRIDARLAALGENHEFSAIIQYLIKPYHSPIQFLSVILVGRTFYGCCCYCCWNAYSIAQIFNNSLNMNKMMNHIALSASELRGFRGEAKCQEPFKAFAAMRQHVSKRDFLTGWKDTGKVQLSIIMHEASTGNRGCWVLSLVK